MLNNRITRHVIKFSPQEYEDSFLAKRLVSL